VLIWKAKAEKALKESGIPYTIVRPGGMERPTDAFKETHNLVLYRKDSLSGGQVSRLQVFFNLSLPLTVTWLNQSKRSTDLVIQLDRELTNRGLFVIKIISLESGLLVPTEIFAYCRVQV
jgi:hypothetical protein